MKVFAPCVVKFFGEHAVVYGKPAIAAAIDKGVYVECEEGGELRVETVAPLSEAVYYPERGRVEGVGVGRFFAYVDAALEVARERWGDLRATFKIKSDFPPSVGLATSAAVSVALLKAYSQCVGARPSPEELARLGHSVELKVQGIASPMDTAVSAMGGLLKIWPSPFRAEQIGAELPQFYVLLLPRRGTTGEIVADVRARLQRRPSLKAVVEAIGEVVEEAHKCLVAGDLACVGELMEINNWLLGALGVVDSRVVQALEILRPFVYGGKISGAGRGGAVLILPRDGGAVEKILTAMNYAYYKVSIYRGGA